MVLMNFNRHLRGWLAYMWLPVRGQYPLGVTPTGVRVVAYKPGFVLVKLS